MRLPRDLSGKTLIRLLQDTGYIVTRQSGSHVRMTHPGPPQHHVTIPLHDALRIGTLAGIVGDVAAALKTSKDDLTQRLFGPRA